MSNDTPTDERARKGAAPDSEQQNAGQPLAWLTPRRGALLVTILTFALYAATMNRTFGFIDKGELVAVASTLGISHPTGYPTIMILGWIATRLVPLREVLTLNGMSALLTAIGAGLLVLLFNDLIGRLRRAPRKGTAAQGKDRGAKGKRAAAPRDAEAAHGAAATTGPAGGVHVAYAALGALFTACTATWWNQGNGFEVYSLHAVMLPLVSLLFLRHVDAMNAAASDANPGFTRSGTLFALVLGLSFTNHLTTVLLAPAFLLYYAWNIATSSNARSDASALLSKRTLMGLLYLAPPFLLGLLPYAWLPIRAAMQPQFNWGNTTTLEALYRHITGQVYQVWMFSDASVFKKQTAYFFGNLPAELAFAGIAVAALGIVAFAERSRKLAAWTALLFVACILYSGNYDIMEIGPYYMTAIFAIGIWAAAGLAWLHERIGAAAALGVGTALVALTCFMNLEESDESGNVLVEDMTTNMLNTLPPKALIFSQQWDFWVAGSFYMQGVEGKRPDVLMIDPELLRRTWYLDQLEHNHPEFMRRVKPAVDAFRKEVYKFDHNLPYDGNVIQNTYVGMMNAMIESTIAERPVLVTGEVDPAVGAGYVRTPDHLALRLTKDTNYLPTEFPRYRFSFWGKRVDSYTTKIYELYARSAYLRALYEAHYGHRDIALRYFDLAIGFDPGIERKDVPDLPLASEENVYESMAFFDQVRSARARFIATQ